MRILSAAMILTVLLTLSLTATGECREIVFVLNSSRAMSESDPNRMVSDAVLWSMENLSGDDEAAIIAFSDEPTVIRPLKPLKDDPIRSLELRYDGQGNAGSALLMALDMLAPKYGSDRAIVLIMSGDNFFDNPTLNERSVEAFQAGLYEAQWLNVPVYIFNLRHNVSPINYRLHPNYAKEIPINSAQLMTALRQFFYDELKVPHVELTTSGKNKGTMALTVPAESIEHLKILLIASNVGSAMITNLKPESVIDGKYVKAFELNEPPTNHFALAVDYPNGTGVTVDAIVKLKPQQVETVNEDEEDQTLLVAEGGAIAALVLSSIPFVRRRVSKGNAR